MSFKPTTYKKFTKALVNVANRFGLHPAHLRIEFFTPNCQAILVEQVENQNYKIHITLEENRIVSIQRLNGTGGYPDHIRQKYREFMK